MKLRGASLRSFRRKLLDWFATSRRDLPWRRTSDPYRIWLSEIMLQQTRVAAVIPYFERFVERFPEMRALASAPEEEVLRAWSGLGYYTRARNLQRTAQHVVARHGGEFPKHLDEVRALPGIGGYTAAAILSIAYGAKLAVLDGNVARVIARVEAVRGDLRAPARWKRMQDTADALLEDREPGNWNQAMMELGATVCTPRSPACLLCPAGEWCRARKLGIAEGIPEQRRVRDTVRMHLGAAVFLDKQGRTLLLPPENKENGDLTGLFSRMWQFPVICVRQDPAMELRARLMELFGPRIKRVELEPLQGVRHAVTYRDIRVIPFLLQVPRLLGKSWIRAVPLNDFANLAISNLTRKIARSVSTSTTFR